MRINYATKRSVAILIFLFAWVLWGTSEPARASCRIENISLQRAGKFTQVTVHADKPFEFVHCTEEAKDGKPYRVIIDCKDAIFALPQNNFNDELPSGTIEGIRTSQFQATPERIVRVVLDLKGPVVYKVIDGGEEKGVTIGILVAGDPDFPVWSAAETKPSEDHRLAEWAKKTTTTFAGTEAQTIHGRRASARAVSHADAGKTTVASRAFLRRKINRYPAPLGPFPQEKPMVQTAEQEGAKKAGVSDQLAVKTIPQATVETKRKEVASSPASKQSLTVRPTARRRISRSPTPLGPFPKEELVADAAAQKRQTEAGAVKHKDVSTSTATAITEGIAKILGPESVVAKETQIVPDNLAALQESRQSELELVPQRKRVDYNPGTKRDPFAPLVDRQDMTFGAAPLPLFENLNLVGILKDEQGNRALLEDEIGFGYILMAGDRIRNGYVISVEDDRATFHIEEYGGFQIMVLELNTEY